MPSRPQHLLARRGPARALRPLVCVMALSLGLVLGGCANLNGIETPDTNSAELAQAGWWRDFHDPLLTELIARAMQANPNILSAQAGP